MYQNLKLIPEKVTEKHLVKLGRQINLLHRGIDLPKVGIQKTKNGRVVRYRLTVDTPDQGGWGFSWHPDILAHEFTGRELYLLMWAYLFKNKLTSGFKLLNGGKNEPR